MSLPLRLRKIIKSSGMNVENFAKHCGVSKSQLYRYLDGEQEPSTAFYRELKKRQNWVNIDWLITGTGDPDIRTEQAQIDDFTRTSIVYGVMDYIDNTVKEEEMVLLDEVREIIMTLLFKGIWPKDKVPK